MFQKSQRCGMQVNQDRNPPKNFVQDIRFLLVTKRTRVKKDRSKTITQTDTGVKVQISNTLVWCLDGFWLMFTLQDSIARMTKLKNAIGLIQILLYTLLYQKS